MCGPDAQISVMILWPMILLRIPLLCSHPGILHVPDAKEKKYPNSGMIARPDHLFYLCYIALILGLDRAYRMVLLQRQRNTKMVVLMERFDYWEFMPLQVQS